MPPAGPLSAPLAERIHRFGPLPFDDFLELALYDPELGFYTATVDVAGRGPPGGRDESGGHGRPGAGREGGDFITSPELGPLFGRVLARALDRWWEGLRRPDPFFVIEAGAGSGTLARSVLDAAPACGPALRYVLVERSSRLRSAQAERLALEPARLAVGPVTTPAEPEDRPEPVPGVGPIVTSLAELPGTAVTGVVLANELLDNVPFRLLERSREGWLEARVTLARAADRFELVFVEAPEDLAREAARFADSASPGARIPLQRRAQDWLRAALGCLVRGRVVVVDYADTTPSLAQRAWQEWLRTYRRHQRGVAPWAEPGGQDVSCEVALDQLAAVRVISRNRSQAEFLHAHGIDDLTAAARETWVRWAHVGDLRALQARSLLHEAAALTDPTGLGRFRVLEWEV